MKPDWKDAPEWANWLAMDDGRGWMWYEYKPYPRITEWKRTGGRSEVAGDVTAWFDSLEARP